MPTSPPSTLNTHLVQSASPIAPASTSAARKVDALDGKIMIVDHEPVNVLVAKKHLQSAGYCNFETCVDTANALQSIITASPDVLLLDVNMPNANGIEILRVLRNHSRFRHLPVLILTANDDAAVKLSCLELGATDFLIKPVDPMELAPRVRNALQNKSYQDQLQHHTEDLEETIQQRTADLERSRREVIYCLARAAEMRDNDTGNHVIRVGRFAGLIAGALGLPDWYVEDIELAAQLHDVGKIAVPDAILLKPGKLMPSEFAVIQTHVKLGHQIIKPHTINDGSSLRRSSYEPCPTGRDSGSLMRLAASITQTHHEKYDGSGYPLGLAGEDIPLEGRITAVADVYDALASERPYKQAMPREKCFSILEESRGSHFDPKVVDAFFAAVPEIVKVQTEFMDHYNSDANPTPPTA